MTHSNSREELIRSLGGDFSNEYKELALVLPIFKVKEVLEGLEYRIFQMYNVNWRDEWELSPMGFILLLVKSSEGWLYFPLKGDEHSFVFQDTVKELELFEGEKFKCLVLKRKYKDDKLPSFKSEIIKEEITLEKLQRLITIDKLNDEVVDAIRS